MKEIWKNILGYEGYYMVSNTGKIKSLSRKVSHSFSGTITMKERIMKPKRNKNGYMEVNLIKDSKRKTFKVHRLVAINFLDNNYNKKEVNHIDGDKTNNLINNLEWVTPSENQIHSYSVLKRKKTNLFGSKNPNYNNYAIYLNTLNGVYYTRGELIKYFGSVYKFNYFKKEKSMGFSNFIKV